MSKIIISAAIRGAHKVVNNAAQKLDDAIAKYGPQQEIGYPDTAYYLPIIYSLMGAASKESERCQGCHGSVSRDAAAHSGRKKLSAVLGTRSGCRSGHPVCRRNLRGHPYPGTAGFLYLSVKISLIKALRKSGSVRPTTSSCGNAAWSSWTAPLPGSRPSSAPLPRWKRPAPWPMNIRPKICTSLWRPKTLKARRLLPSS